tara:strand:+ start:7672 stop:7929 length:258 start_codon:yes stop_codon:yes gene_type:complete
MNVSLKSLVTVSAVIVGFLASCIFLGGCIQIKDGEIGARAKEVNTGLPFFQTEKKKDADGNEEGTTTVGAVGKTYYDPSRRAARD